MKKGLSEIGDRPILGEFLRQDDEGRHVILLGKFRGAYADEIPRGYIRHFIVAKCGDDLTPKEKELFERYGKKPEEKNESDLPAT